MICHSIFPYIELLSCLCLQWFSILSSPVLNCCPVSACRDLPSCLPLYWIAILSLPTMICNLVFPCIKNPSCKLLQWFSILSSPHWLVYHWLSLHFGYQSSYPCYGLSFFLDLYSFPVPCIPYLLVSLPCPMSNVSCVFLCTQHSPWIARRWI